MATRKLTKILSPRVMKEGAGVLLKRLIGQQELSYLDPFLLLDHFGSRDPADYSAGFPMHPHRGIETVTYVLSGEIAHRDSMGNEGVVRAGGVQWMTAGSGIIHEEMPSVLAEDLEGFQLWVNLPAAAKMSDPGYRGFEAGEIPTLRLGDGLRVKVIAGDLQGTKGAVADIAAGPDFFDIVIPQGGRFSCAVPVENSCFVYVYKGSAVVDGDQSGVLSERLGVLGKGDNVELEAGDAGCSALLVSGRPLNEPVSRYGPFVMNSRAEIETALRELKEGKFVKRSA